MRAALLRGRVSHRRPASAPTSVVVAAQAELHLSASSQLLNAGDRSTRRPLNESRGQSLGRFSAGVQPGRHWVSLRSVKADGGGGGRAARCWRRRRAEIGLDIAGRGSDVSSHRGGSAGCALDIGWGQKRLSNGNGRRRCAQDRAPAAPMLVRGRLHQGPRPRQPRRCAGLDRLPRAALCVHLRISHTPPAPRHLLLRRRSPLSGRPHREPLAGPMRERGATTRGDPQSLTCQKRQFLRSPPGSA